MLVALYVKVSVYVCPTVGLSIGLFSAMYPLGSGVLQLVTDIFPAYDPEKESLVVVRVATLPSPEVLMLQGDAELVSKSPLAIRLFGIALSAEFNSVKLIRIMVMPASILVLLFCVSLLVMLMKFPPPGVMQLSFLEGHAWLF